MKVLVGTLFVATLLACYMLIISNLPKDHQADAGTFISNIPASQPQRAYR